jgi:hypothetical protein
MTDASAGNLPNPHDFVPLFSDANGVNLNVADISVILNPKNVS